MNAKASSNFCLPDLIELRDGLLRICNGLQQIIAFAAEESEPLFAFVVFLEPPSC